MGKQNELIADSYHDFLRNLKTRIRQSQVKAALSVNQELILLYWQIGQDILARQQQEGWGSKVVDRLAQDLKLEFPGMQGFSSRNLKYMRAFAEAYPAEAIVQQVAAQVPWAHHCVLLDKVKDPNHRLWYMQKTIENAWSRNVLVHQIASALHDRQGDALTNFPQTLPAPQSDLAQSLLKSAYNLDFLMLREQAQERELERALINHMQKFLLELGVGFAFVGSQYRLEVEGTEFFIDLLFYHLRLRCYVVIELKTTEFQPEYAGQINFYINVVDEHLRHSDDQPTIGLVLCRARKEAIVHYALRGMTQPIGVSTYNTQLPESVQASLPSVEQLQEEMAAISVEQLNKT